MQIAVTSTLPYDDPAGINNSEGADKQESEVVMDILQPSGPAGKLRSKLTVATLPDDMLRSEDILLI